MNPLNPATGTFQVTDWIYYAGQDEVKPPALHQDWPQDLRELGPIWLPAEVESSFYRQRARPKAPTCQGHFMTENGWSEVSDVMGESRGACGHPPPHGEDSCGNRKGFRLGDSVEGMP